jgi:chemotaxis protein CheX
MPATQEIPETLIRENISRAVSHVFKTMLTRMPTLTFAGNQDPAQRGIPWPQAKTGEAHMISTVGFLGAVNGLIYIYLPLAFARLCARTMLGITERELDDLREDGLNDAIGELTNITVGTFKSGLCDAGFPCMLTMPSILRGNGFSAEPGGPAHGQIYAFDCAGHRIVVDILIKLAE